MNATIPIFDDACGKDKKALASLPLQAKFIRDERWDVMSHLFSVLERNAGVDLSPQAMANALLNAGAVPDDSVRPEGGPVPRIRLAGMLKGDERVLHFTAFSDGSIVIEAENRHIDT